MTLAIVGSRSWPDPEAVKQYVRDLDPRWTTIVTGGATGVDTWAEEAARETGREVVVIRPDYQAMRDAGLNTRAAPLLRNRLIVLKADAVTAFWHGESRGTANAIKHAQELGKRLKIVKWENLHA